MVDPGYYYNGTEFTPRPRFRTATTPSGNVYIVVDMTSRGVTFRHRSNPFNRTDYEQAKWEEALQKIIAINDTFREDFKTFFRGGLIPHKGYGGPTTPVKELLPPIVTAAPAPDDRRRAIWAFMTVRPTRVP